MPEARNNKIVTNIEDTFYEIIQRVATSESQSLSGYLRDLIVKDLMARDLVSEHDLRKVVAG